MPYAEMKETICNEFGWNYNDIDVEITWRCQIGEHQYYPILIICDGSFKTMINFFIQSSLNMMIFYVSSQSKSLCVLNFAGFSNSVGRGKNSLLLDDLLHRINDTMFDNACGDQYIFGYSKLSDNEYGVDNDNVVNDEIIPYVIEFVDSSRSKFVVLHVWTLSHKRMSGGYDLVVSQTFSCKNELVSVVKLLHIAQTVEYRVQQSNSIFIQLQCMQAP